MRVPSGTTIITMPPGPEAGPVTLSRTQASTAWLESSIRQAAISAATWGFIDKLTVEFATALNKALEGGRAATALSAVGSNLLGGVFLGVAHPIAEAMSKKAFIAFHGGKAYTPATDSSNGKNVKELTFALSFAITMALKTAFKKWLITVENPWENAAESLATDAAFSAAGGAIAQCVVNLLTRTGKYIPVKDTPLKLEEIINRLSGGSAAGAIGGLFDASAKLGKLSGLPDATIDGFLKSFSMLLTWFKVRDTAAGMWPKAAGVAPDSLATGPIPSSGAREAGDGDVGENAGEDEDCRLQFHDASSAGDGGDGSDPDIYHDASDQLPTSVNPNTGSEVQTSKL